MTVDNAQNTFGIHIGEDESEGLEPEEQTSDFDIIDRENDDEDEALPCMALNLDPIEEQELNMDENEEI
eukprot:c28607_g1_i2 orf=672-878(-)